MWAFLLAGIDRGIRKGGCRAWRFRRKRHAKDKTIPLDCFTDAACRILPPQPCRNWSLWSIAFLLKRNHTFPLKKYGLNQYSLQISKKMIE